MVPLSKSATVAVVFIILVPFISHTNASRRWIQLQFQCYGSKLHLDSKNGTRAVGDSGVWEVTEALG